MKGRELLDLYRTKKIKVPKEIEAWPIQPGDLTINLGSKSFLLNENSKKREGSDVIYEGVYWNTNHLRHEFFKIEVTYRSGRLHRIRRTLCDTKT